MKRSATTVLLAALLLLAPGAFAQGENRRAVIEDLARRNADASAAATAAAERRGWVRRATSEEGVVYELIALQEGVPVYFQTLSANTGISAAIDLIREVPPYNLSGSGWAVGVWDSGSIRTDHVELTPRVTVMDGADISNHATFVAGIVAARGVHAPAIGGAPDVAILSYDWVDVEVEIAQAAAEGAFDPAPAVFVANLSFGEAVGWTQGSFSGNSGRHFFGFWPEDNPPAKSDLFGRYTTTAAQWDALAHAVPYTLLVKAAGNDRNDAAPSSGQTFYRLEWDGEEFTWVPETYDPSIHPPGDGVADGGYDTIPPFSTAKNLLTVGSVTDAVTGGVRDVAAASINAFSVWGPTDDGRIKPDLMANGSTVTSTTIASSSSYGGPASGTSFSAPSVSGGAVLLQELHASLHDGAAMRACMLKGLLIHTADDLTVGPANPGPDYATGWGLVNFMRAANQIDSATQPDAREWLIQGTLSNSTPMQEFYFESDGSEEIRVTLSWLDPPGEPLTGMDNRTPVLVHDLDLRLEAPDETLHLPFVLDVENPSAPATNGDNVVDPLEQVRIADPDAGHWVVRVTHKDSLAEDGQVFSLLVSGLTESEPLSTAEWLLYD